MLWRVLIIVMSATKRKRESDEKAEKSDGYLSEAPLSSAADTSTSSSSLSSETKRIGVSPAKVPIPIYVSTSNVTCSVSSSSSSSSSTVALISPPAPLEPDSMAMILGMNTTFEQITGHKRQVTWNNFIGKFPTDTTGSDIVFECSDDAKCGFSTFVLSTCESSIWKTAVVDRKARVVSMDFPSSVVCTVFEWLMLRRTTVHGIREHAWISRASNNWGIPALNWLYALGCCAYQYGIVSLYLAVVRHLIHGKRLWTAGLEKFMQETSLPYMVRSHLAVSSAPDGNNRVLAELKLAAALDMYTICAKYDEKKAVYEGIPSAACPTHYRLSMLSTIVKIQLKEIETILLRTTEKLPRSVYGAICFAINSVNTESLMAELNKTAIGQMHREMLTIALSDESAWVDDKA
jgi:hypothetical protein